MKRIILSAIVAFISISINAQFKVFNSGAIAFGSLTDPGSEKTVFHDNAEFLENVDITSGLDAYGSIYFHGTPAWNGDYWINTPDDDKYWNDSSFYLVSDTTLQDLRVSYAETVDHSAVTSVNLGYFTSKWGFNPLFYHAINDCPYEPRNLRYIRDVYQALRTKLTPMIILS